ncbi:MAG: bifunctional metallophosphatase/5'-nucleotidase [Rhodospirillaceae bacterium]|nr:bifunctional metallophosphatase/5'-nucleotidase [Rhodospirillaceae bacterium]
MSPVPLRILAINDFHGNIQTENPSPGRLPLLVDGKEEMVETGGAAFLAAHIARERAGHANSILVSAGDLTGASPLVSALLRDQPTIEVMNQIGLDLNAVGNHEFDHGMDELRRKMEGDGEFGGADFDYLAANVVSPTALIQPFGATAIREFDGARVGFIGVVTEETPTIVSAKGIKGLVFSDPLDVLNNQAAVLRKMGVEAIVAVLHEGAAAPAGIAQDGAPCEGMSGALVDIVKGADPAIDLFISGHTHQAYACRLDGRLVTQTASYGRMLSVIDLTLKDGDVVAAAVRNQPVTRDLAPDPGIAALVARAEAATEQIRAEPVADLPGQVTRAPDASGESALGDLIADAQLASARLLGASIAFMNPGGIRQDLPSNPGKTDVSLGDLFAVQPFGNNLVAMDLSGAEIKALLEQQWIDQPADRRPRILQVSAGFSYCYDARRADGDKILAQSLRLDGKLIVPEETYRIVVNSFLADGGDRFTVLRNGRNRVQGDNDLDALRTYISARSGSLALQSQGRICRKE